jgi:PAS domain-containing protein
MNSKVQQLAAKFALNIVDFDPSQERETGWLSKLEQELQMRRRTMRTARTTLDAMLNHGQQGILIIDSQHRVTLCNKRAQQLLNLPNELISNNPLYADLIDYQYKNGEFSCYEIPEGIRDRAAKITDSPECYERLRPNGTMLEVRSVPTPDGGAVRTFTDVTARREQENCLRRTEAEYRSLFDNAVIGIYRSSIDGRLLRANAALVHMNGYSSEDEMIAAVNCRASEI